jgi:ABC-type transport system involved in multi-copper enzyme maturation permease subunit
LTSGAISGERERKTYDLLRTTLLSARALIMGKLAFAVMYLLLLILAAVPLEGLAFVLGGVAIEELVLALVILVVTALAFSAIGLFFSAFSRTTRGATGLAYGTTVMATVVLPILLAIVATVGEAVVVFGGDGPEYSWGVQAVLIYLLYLGAGLSPVATAVVTRTLLVEQETIWLYWMEVDAGHRIPIPSPWIVYTVIYIGLTVVLLALAARRVSMTNDE